jgi:hypothetical protein
MAQIQVRLSEAETGIKGGISVGTGRYNQESAIQVVIDMVKRSGGSIGDAAIAAIIEQQNPGAPANVKESHEEFEEALSLGIDPRTFNSVSNTKELLKQAKAGTRLTSNVIQEIDAPTRNVQRTASLRDYNLLTNQDPDQKVYDLYKGQAAKLFGIAKDATIGDLTDAKLDQLTAAQGQIGSDLFWAVRKEQDRRVADTGTDTDSWRGSGGGFYKEMFNPEAGGDTTTGSPMMGDDKFWNQFLEWIESRGTDLTLGEFLEGAETYLSQATDPRTKQPYEWDFSTEEGKKNLNDFIAHTLDNYSLDESSLGRHMRGLFESVAGFGDPNIYEWDKPMGLSGDAQETVNPLMDLPGGSDPARSGAVWEMFNPLQQETFGQAYEREGAIQGGGPLAERYRAMMAPIAQLQYKLQPEAMGLMSPGASPREFLRSGQMLGGEDLGQRLTRLSDMLRGYFEDPKAQTTSYGVDPATLAAPGPELGGLTGTPEGMRFLEDMFLHEGFKDPQMQALAGILPSMMQSAPQTWGVLSRGAKNLANIALGTDPNANILKLLGYGR